MTDRRLAVEWVDGQSDKVRRTAPPRAASETNSWQPTTGPTWGLSRFAGRNDESRIGGDDVTPNAQPFLVQNFEQGLHEGDDHRADQ